MLLQITEKQTELRSVTAVKGNNSATPQNMDPENFCYYPPPLNLDPGKFLLLPPPPLNPFGQKSVCPPKWMLARTPMLVGYLTVPGIVYQIEGTDGF